MLWISSRVSWRTLPNGRVTTMQKIFKTLSVGLACLLFVGGLPADEATLAPLAIGFNGANCNEDPNCINRLHPNIPMRIRAQPGQVISLAARNASDFDLDPHSDVVDPRKNDPVNSTVHPLTGPVYIEGAKAGDVLAVTLLEIRPGDYGITLIMPSGFVSDTFPGPPFVVVWKLGERWAVSDQMPGIRIPNAGFPGIVTTLPGPTETRRILDREAALLASGGAVTALQPINASPAAVCGPQGTHKQECLRTTPPREHGGNVDIRYLGAGVTIYLPCQIDGCGLAVGDVHYAQGDGEVSGTAIEMDATVVLRTAIVRDRELPAGIHYEGPSRLLDIPSTRFYATTGYPFKDSGTVPPDMRYLESTKIAGLTNLSKDVSLAARNALLEMIRYLTVHRGLTREQAYVVTSVAVDLRIGQLVDSPNVGVSAILPLDIFTD